MEKKCLRCYKTKEFSEFNKANKRKDGRREACRECEKEYRLSEEVQTRRYERDLKNKYGLSIDNYNKMFEQQEGRCGICKRHQTELIKKLVVDHCHDTGKVRGLLCDKCNRGVGFLGDNLEGIKSAVNYLEETFCE